MRGPLGMVVRANQPHKCRMRMGSPCAWILMMCCGVVGLGCSDAPSRDSGGGVLSARGAETRGVPQTIYPTLDAEFAACRFYDIIEPGSAKEAAAVLESETSLGDLSQSDRDRVRRDLANFVGYYGSPSAERMATCLDPRGRTLDPLKEEPIRALLKDSIHSVGADSQSLLAAALGRIRAGEGDNAAEPGTLVSIGLPPDAVAIRTLRLGSPDDLLRVVLPGRMDGEEVSTTQTLFDLDADLARARAGGSTLRVLTFQFVGTWLEGPKGNEREHREFVTVVFFYDELKRKWLPASAKLRGDPRASFLI